MTPDQARTRQQQLWASLTLAILALAFTATTVVTTYVAIWTQSGRWGATAFASGCLAFLFGCGAAEVAS